MIGDGANDALAIKKADLGIALFDGSQATRQVASIVLVKNSFSDLTNMDSNIDTVFYDKAQLKDALVEADNDLEKKWRKRILIEHAPLCGNIIMYYDAYKLGFAYYCDYSVSYDILNKVAMKYVITYQCRDFFIDELERPEDKPSKLLRLFEEDTKAKGPVKEKNSNANLRAGPFAKFKNYTSNGEPTKKSEPIKDKMRNCFIHRGKMANFSFLQKPVIKKNGFETNMSKGLFENSSVQKEVFSYRDFKAARLKLD
jgi:hypothetical protein